MKKISVLSCLIRNIIFILTVSSFAAGTGQVEQDSCLIGYWSFDEGMGVAAKDNSGNNNHGKISGPKWVKGKKGFALQFNGIDDYVSCGKIPLTSPFTFAAWVKLTGNNRHRDKGTPTKHYVISKRWKIALIAESYPESIYSMRLDGTKPQYALSGSYKTSDWHHLVGICTKGEIRIYVDGLLGGKEEIKEGTLKDNPGSLYIGNGKPYYPTCGIIDEVRLYSRALSEEEVMELSRATTAHPRVEKEPELIGYWPLDEGKGSTAFDLSAKQNNGKIIGAKWAKDEKGNAALEFDGIDDYVTIPHQDYLNVEDELTLELWVNVKTIDRDPVLIEKGRLSGYSLSQHNAKVQFLVRTEQDGTVDKARLRSNRRVLKPRQWYHVAATFSKKRRKIAIYYDGEKIREIESKGEKICCYPGPVQSCDSPHLLPLRIGALSISPVHSFNFGGYIREVKIYNRALTQGEIEESYEKNIEIKKLKLIPADRALETSLPCRIKVKIVDADTNNSLNAKVYLENLKENKGYYPANSFAYGIRGNNPFFYAFGSFDLKLPSGKTEIWVTHGFEYMPQKITVDLNPQEEKELIVRLKRFIDLPARGWYCGEDELQYSSAHGKGKYYSRLTKDPSNPAKIAQAEGLNWIHFVHRPQDNETLSKLSTERFIAINGLELCNRLAGDVIAITQERPPAGCGGPFMQTEDVDEVLKQGKVVDIADTSTLKGVRRPVLESRGREIPVLVALNKAHLMHQAFFRTSLREKVSYRFLNLGFKFAAGAGTDTYMTSPTKVVQPGWIRAYLKLDKLSWGGVIRSYKQQRIFTTTGPILLFNIGDKLPGDTIFLSGENKEELSCKIEACSIYGVEKVEIIKNGNVIETLLPESGKILEKFPIEVGETCWIAARCYGKQGKFFGNFAHTSPIYVQFGEKSMDPKKQDIDYFLQWLEDYKKAIKGIAKKHGAKPKDYQHLYELIDEAKNVYNSLIEKPRKWINAE